MWSDSKHRIKSGAERQKFTLVEPPMYAARHLTDVEINDWVRRIRTQNFQVDAVIFYKKDNIPGALNLKTCNDFTIANTHRIA